MLGDILLDLQAHHLGLISAHLEMSTVRTDLHLSSGFHFHPHHLLLLLLLLPLLLLFLGHLPSLISRGGITLTDIDRQTDTDVA